MRSNPRLLCAFPIVDLATLTDFGKTQESASLHPTTKLCMYLAMISWINHLSKALSSATYNHAQLYLKSLVPSSATASALPAVTTAIRQDGDVQCTIIMREFMMRKYQ